MSSSVGAELEETSNELEDEANHQKNEPDLHFSQLIFVPLSVLVSFPRASGKTRDNIPPSHLFPAKLVHHFGCHEKRSRHIRH